MNSLRKYSSLIVWGVIVVFILIFTLVMNNLGDAPMQYDDTYYVRNYQVRYEYESGRSFKVTEQITAVFTVSGKHGIIRDLPYDGGEAYGDIRSDDVFDTDMSSGFISVYLGDESRTVPRNEPVTYTLEYTFKLPASAGSDTVYINLIGGGWTTKIENAVCTLVLPAAPTGVLVNESEFNGSHTLNGNTLTVNVQDLSAFTPVTVQCAFEKGVLGSTAPDTGEIIVLIIAGALLVAAIILALLIPKHDPTPVVNFDPPEGIDPLLAGSLIDGSVQNGDITSLIYYWAYKKKLTIDFSNENDPVLNKIAPLDDSAPEHERIVFERIFRDGDSASVSSFTNTFYATASKAKKLAEKQTPKMFSQGSAAVAAVFVVAAALLCFLTVLFRGLHIHSSVFSFGGILAAIPLIAVFAIGYWYQKNSLRVSKKAFAGILIGQAAITAVFTTCVCILIPQMILLDIVKPFLCLLTAFTAVVAPFLLRRRKEYVDEINPLLGFREFIRLAEKDRLEMMLEQDPELYYHILPYAQVLGVSDIWEEKFKDIKMDPPAWATMPGGTVFDFIVLNSVMRSATRSMTTAFVSRPASSGRSGGGHFGGGGGFRGGGGFGGGGGRSW